MKLFRYPHFPISTIVILCFIFFLPNLVCGQLPISFIQEFEQLEETFNKIASHPLAISTNLSASNVFFKKCLNEHPDFYAFIRVNSKGIIANEVIKGRPLGKPSYRQVGHQLFFKQVKKTRLTYRSFLIQKNGKQFLIWANPIILPRTHTPDKFGGVVLGKIHLNSKLQSMASKFDQPLLLSKSGKTIFKYKWTNHPNPYIQEIKIPGLPQSQIQTLPITKNDTSNVVPPTFHPGKQAPDQPSNKEAIHHKVAEEAVIKQIQNQQANKKSFKLIWLILPIGAAIIGILIFLRRSGSSKQTYKL